MKRLVGLLFAIASTAGVALAAGGDVPSAPEINPATAVSALTLLGGSIVVIRARLKK